MAEEEKKAEGEEKPKKKKMFLIIIIVVVLGVGVGAMKFLGIGPFKKKVVEEPKEKEQVVKEPPKPEVKIGPMVPMEPIIVNLADPSGRRYVKITMNFELDRDKTKEEFEKRLPQIKDILIILLRSKTSAELNDPGGIFKLKEEIISRINALLITGKVKRVYFTDFVIQ